MAVVPPAPERRRPRRGSLERPINGRLYRGTWLLVGLPLLVVLAILAVIAWRLRRTITDRRAVQPGAS